EFEEAARLRDEVKRLRETELAVADDPLARQAAVEDQAGSYGSPRKSTRTARSSARPRKPQPGEMGPGSERTVPLRDVMKPAKTIDVAGPSDVKKRRGRPKKTGRPGA
ncbi:MAG: excinuclease ABC subunit UvrB, partial [Hyphomicrobiaceae bacterium]